MAIYSDNENDENIKAWEQSMKKPTIKRVVFEIEINAETNIEAAKIVQDWLRNPNDNWQFYVQDEDTKKIVSVDLDEDESCMEHNVNTNEYSPMIEV